MVRSLLSIACHVYGFAAFLYLAYLIRQWNPIPVVGRVLIGSGLVSHAIALGLQLSEQGGRTIGFAQGCSLLAFLLLAIFFVLDLVYRKPVLGAFLTPLAVAIFLVALLMPDQVGPLPEDLKQPLLPVHITSALLGLAAVAVAAGVALMYVLLERQMKGKRFGLLFSRLPSLQFLDELSRRLVIGGFVLLSFTLITGAFFSSGVSGFTWRWSWREIATLSAWAMLATILGARLVAGWQGRRTAFMTMAGFSILLVSFFSYYEGR